MRRANEAERKRLDEELGARKEEETRLAAETERKRLDEELATAKREDTALNETDRKYAQGPIYNRFCWEVTKLKNLSENMTGAEIIRICEELEEIAPKLITLEK